MPNYLEDLTGLSQLFSETIDDQVMSTVNISFIPVQVSYLSYHLSPCGCGRAGDKVYWHISW